jgi:hypothetical protein
LRLAERQTDEASIPFTGGTMLKSGAIITLIAAMIAARVVLAQAPPTDKELRAAFCIGALDAAVASDSPFIQPLSPSLPPEYRRLDQEYRAKWTREKTEARERLRRFLSPSIGGASLAPSGELRKSFIYVVSGT